MFETERNEVAAFMRRLYRRHLTTTSGGNVSWRVSDDCVLLTASRHDKGTLRGEHVGVLTLAGENLTPHLVPSIESGMHLGIYRAHAGTRAVVHAHPPVASAFSAMRRPINCRLIAESYAILGDPSLLPYATMGTEELAQVVADGLSSACAVLMANHGVLTVGNDLLEAYDRLEVLEAAAQMTVLTTLMDDGVPLSGTQLAELDVLMGR